MGDIEMVNNDIPALGRQEESTVQQGGGGTIDIFGTQMPLPRTPLSSVQKSGGGGTVDWTGEQGLLDRTPNPPQGMSWPADKGKA
jgi:hypothetical protein